MTPYELAKAHFRTRLRTAMKRAGYDQKTLAIEVGMSRWAVGCWVNGRTMPKGEVAARLAEVLDAPDLVGLTLDARRRVCAWCQGAYQATEKLTVARFCTKECRVAWWHWERSQQAGERRLDNLVQTRTEVDRLRHERRTLTSAIDAMCRACEWDGVCKDAGCALRDVSPLPLAKRATA